MDCRPKYRPMAVVGPVAFALTLLCFAPFAPFASFDAPALAAPGSSDGTAWDPAVDGVWGQLPLTGMVPPDPAYHCAAYDPIGNRMVIAGINGQTWALSLDGSDTWTKLVSSGSPAIQAARMVYDPIRHRMMFVAGGYTNGIWVLDMTNPTAWTQLTTTGGPPQARAFAVVAFDEAADRLILTSGWNGGSGVNDTWALDMSPTPTWNVMSPTGTPPPAGSTITGAFDAGNRRLFVFGGYAGGLYQLDLAGAPAWSAVTLAPGSPSPVSTGYATSVYVPALNAFVMQGGNNINTRLSTAWMCLLGPSAGWVTLNPTGTPPPGADLAAAVFDPTHLRMVIFGGTGSNGHPTTITWEGAAPPVILGVSPIAGPVGSEVTISGLRLDGTTEVAFGAVLAAFTFSSSSELHATVPQGAVDAPIQVTTPLGSALSAITFTVGSPPVVESAAPPATKVGRAVLLHGHNMHFVTGLGFTGADNAVFTVLSDSTISTLVPLGAVTGPIRTKSAFGTLASAFDFVVLPTEPRPYLVSVRDVPNDQGGSVIVRWEGSDFDTPVNSTVKSYRVWRRAPLSAAALLAGAPAPDLAGPPGYWEVLGEMPSAQLGGYAFTAETFQDSLESGPGHVAFFVQAVTANAAQFYFSDVDSGYSVDNLAPPTPGQLHASYAASELRLGWLPSRAPDLREYRVYRGPTANFPVSPATFVGATTDTTWTETVAYGSWYKLVAVDVHGNKSRVAQVGPDSPVGALASLQDVAATSRNIRLTWVSTANPGLWATVYRRVGEWDWQPQAVLQADGTGRLMYDDQDVVPGTRYGYRLGIWDGDGEVFLGEAWATAEDAEFAFAPAGLTGNPARGADMSLRFGLAAAGSVRVDVLDIAGRRVASYDFGRLEPGPHDLALRGSARLAAGVYLVRFHHGDQVQTLRGVVLN